MRIGDIPVGDGAPLVLITGVNVVESEETTLAVAHQLRDIAPRHDFPVVIKASVDKANLSSMSSYRGLGFDEGLRDVLSSLLADYVEQFKQLAVVEELRQANQSLWQYDSETGVTTPPTAEMIDRIYRLRRQSIEAIREADGAFFDGQIDFPTIEPINDVPNDEDKEGHGMMVLGVLAAQPASPEVGMEGICHGAEFGFSSDDTELPGDAIDKAVAERKR